MCHRLLFVGASWTTSTRQCRWRQAVAILGHDPLYPRRRSLRRPTGLPLHRIRPVESGTVRCGEGLPRRLRQPAQGALPLRRPAVSARTGRRRAVPGNPARLHAVSPSAHRLRSADRWPVHRHRDRNRFRQDRVLPLSGARPLPHAGRHARRQGHRHLSHERSRVGSGAANCRDRRPHIRRFGAG